MRLAREELTEATLEDAALSGGLFVKRLLILIDDPFPPSRVTTEEDAGEEEEVTNSIDFWWSSLCVNKMKLPNAFVRDDRKRVSLTGR